jgi:citronellol/citronellal dehydrogenase
MGASLADDQIESMEEMVEAIVALCDCPPERSGGTHVSLDLLRELALPVHRLDGTPLTR